MQNGFKCFVQLANELRNTEQQRMFWLWLTVGLHNNHKSLPFSISILAVPFSCSFYPLKRKMNKTQSFMFLSLWFVTTIQDLSLAILNKFLWDFRQPTFKSQQWCLRNVLRFNDCNIVYANSNLVEYSCQWNQAQNRILYTFLFYFSTYFKRLLIINFTDECWSNIHKNRIQFQHFQSEKKQY